MKKIAKLFVFTLFTLLLIGGMTSCEAAHTHTYASDWSRSQTAHWKASTCNHDVKLGEGAHSFDVGVVENGTHTVYTCSVCNYQKREAHTHDFGAWTIATAPTIFEIGEQIRACKYVSCSATENRDIPKVEVTALLIQALPSKTQYIVGESFDKSGLTVIAVGDDYSQTDVTALVEFDKTILSYSDSAVTASFGGKSVNVLISVRKHTHTYEGEWTVSSPATILSKGQKYRVCAFAGCTEKEYEEIEAVAVSSLTVAALPEKTAYNAGDAFEPYGLKILANGEDNSQIDVTSLVAFDKAYLSAGDTVVIASFGGKTAEIEVTVQSLEAHTHRYEGEWTVSSPATILSKGQKYRVCAFEDCTEKEYEEIEAVAVSSLTVAALPEKTSYDAGEAFEPYGLKILANGEDNSQMDVTSLVAFDKANLSAGDTVVIASFGGKTAEIEVTVQSLEAHTHTYEGEWQISTPPTIFSAGQKYRVCSYEGCEQMEIVNVDAIEVVSIKVEAMPDKTEYFSGESFSSTGLVIKALGADESLTDVTALVSYDKTVLNYTDTVVTATYAEKSCEIAVSVERIYTVAEAFGAFDSTEDIFVEGIYVGVADEGSGFAKELLLKDKNSDKLISVIGVSYGEFPNYGYKKGDLVRICGRLVKEVYNEAEKYSQNKTYLEFSDANPADINKTVISRGNNVSFKLADVVEIDSWADMKEFFTPENVEAYTYVHFTGKVWFNTYTKASDGVYLHRFSMNSSAGMLADIKPDGVRAVGFRENVLLANTPALMSGAFAEPFGSAAYPGTKATVDFYAVVTATNNVNYQLTILETNWVAGGAGEKITVETNQDIVREVAYAFYRQGAQIYYDQTWRSENASPEDATSQRQMTLDCSSYVNSVYYEAFGYNILGVPLAQKSCTTANYTQYAKENLGKSPDVIGYWVNADYTTEAEQKELLLSILESLEVGDIIVYRRGKTSETSGHTLIYVGNNKFLHSTGTKCTYSETNPDASKDIASKVEYQKGTIDLLDADEMFKKTTSSRYLFRKSEELTVFNISHLRPLAFDLQATEKTESRVKIAGVDAEKTVLPGLGMAVCPGEMLTYTVSIQNYSSNRYSDVLFEEILSENVEFLYGSECLTLSEGKLRANLTIAGGDALVISWTVKVKADAENGARIESKNTTLGGLNVFATENYVSAYTESQLASVADKARELAGASATYADPIEFANAIYKLALGADVFDIGSTAALLESVLVAFNGGTRLMVNENSEYADITLTDLCNGRAMSGTLPFASYLTEEDLQLGDLIFCEWQSGYRLFVYVGDNEFVRIDTLTDTATLVSGGEKSYVLNENSYELQNLYNSFRSYPKCVVMRPTISNK